MRYEEINDLCNRTIIETQALLVDIDDDIERFHIATHPDKMRLLHILLRGSSDAATLQKALQEKRKVIAVHLNELEQLGLVEVKNQ
jgi:predicted transcriptional regulator